MSRSHFLRCDLCDTPMDSHAPIHGGVIGWMSCPACGYRNVGMSAGDLSICAQRAAVVMKKRRYGQRGMTLRDYFAGQALAGSLANTDAPTPEIEARWAYEIADAMLAERAKEPKAK